MESSLVLYILNNDFYAKKFDPQIYPKNLLPKNLQKNKIYVVHSCDSSSSKKKGHYVVLDTLFSKSNLCITFFDTFGRKFPYTEIKNIVQFNVTGGASFCFNHIRFQPIRSTICADLSLFYILWRCRGYTLKDIQIKKFSNLPKENLKKIPPFIEKLLPMEIREKRKKKKLTWKDFS